MTLPDDATHDHQPTGEVPGTVRKSSEPSQPTPTYRPDLAPETHVSEHAGDDTRTRAPVEFGRIVFGGRDVECSASSKDDSARDRASLPTLPQTGQESPRLIVDWSATHRWP